MTMGFLNCSKLATALALATSVVSWTSAWAEEPVPMVPDATSGWTLSFTTYSWLPWMSGQTGVRGRTFDVQATPVDVIKALDWSSIPVWMSYAELRNGRFALFNDIVYSKLAGSAGFERSRQGPLLAGAVRADVDADYEQTTLEFGAAYEVWSEGAAKSAGHTAVDILGGVRYWRQELDVSADISASATLQGPLGIVDLTRSGNRIIAKSGTVDWVDPFVGARLRYDIDAAQSVAVRGDIGGFGVGSDFSWQAIATYNWQMCVTDRYVLDGYVGYRALSVDYSQGSGTKRYEFDAVQHGPVLGATLRF